jgi:hypothetical protein
MLPSSADECITCGGHYWHHDNGWAIFQLTKSFVVAGDWSAREGLGEKQIQQQ